MVGVVIHLQEIDIIVTAMAEVEVEVEVAVEYPGALNFAVCRPVGTFIRF